MLSHLEKEPFSPPTPEETSKTQEIESAKETREEILGALDSALKELETSISQSQNADREEWIFKTVRDALEQAKESKDGIIDFR